MSGYRTARGVTDNVTSVSAVLAHQGDWQEPPGGLPPNSAAAVVEAVRAGADGAEIDARMSADGVVVVHHDAVLGADDTARGCRVPPGTPICQLKRDEVAHLSTLVELFDGLQAWVAEAPGTRTAVLNVELKDLPGEPGWDQAHTLAREVARLVMEAGAGEWPAPAGGTGLRVVVSCFDPAPLAELRRQAPQLATGLLISARYDWRPMMSLNPGWRTVHPEHPHASPELFETASAAGLAVVPWTVDDPAKAAALVGMGATGVITNRPRSVLAALGR